MAKAELEYEKWYARQAALPSPVEEHFDQVVKEIKRLEQAPLPQMPKPRKQGRKNRRGGAEEGDRHS
jgi:hypothetical protein